MDDSDIRIRTGIEISKQTIGRLHARAAARGIGFVVLLVPTKEFVFLPRVADPARHIGLVELAKTEQRLHREISDFLTAGGIAFLDATGPLRAAAEQPYRENGDGHLNRLGHRIIADRLAEFLKSANR
jgi:lysophospholipase L1-like esterase